MRVFLLCPPARTTGPASPPRHWPLYALLTAAALREAGHEVIFEDAHRAAPDPVACARRIEDAHPDAVVLFAGDYNRRIPIDALAAHLGLLGGHRVLIGGRHSLAEARRLLTALPSADAAAVGEPEAATLGWLEGGAAAGVLHTPDAVVDPAGLTATPRAPAWDLARPRDYGISPHQSRGAEVFPVLTSRGCPYGCFYCEVRSQAAYAAHDPERVLAEVTHLMVVYGARSFFLADPMFALDRSQALALCAGLKRLGVRWSAMTRTDRVDPALLQAMADAGCWSLIFGVESLTPSAQTAMHKRLAVETVGPAIRAAKAAGIEVIASAMVGLPGDSPGGVQHTVSRLIELEPDFAQFFEVRVPDEYTVEGGTLEALPSGDHQFDGSLYVGKAFGSAAAIQTLTAASWRRFYLRGAYLKTRVRALRRRPQTELQRGLQGAALVFRQALGGRA